MTLHDIHRILFSVTGLALSVCVVLVNGGSM